VIGLKTIALGGVVAFVLGFGAAWLIRGDTIDALHESIYGVGGYQERLGLSAQANNELRRVNASQKAEIAKLATAWRNTQADAEEARAEAETRAVQYRAAEAKLREVAHAPDADPADVAGSVIDCLRRLRAAAAPAAC
jgi:hypothetical protein